MRRTAAIYWFASLALGLSWAFTAAAQDATEAESSAPSVEFPATWANSDPISAASLRGKAAILYFFEESCPRCRERWPTLMATAAKYADQPVVFIAVSSGTTKSTAEQYARSVGLSWPVIVDMDRSFERRADIGEISLQNTMQVSYLSAGGELRHGNWSKFDDTIRQALEGAKWNVDPEVIPAELHAAWLSIEYGNYVEAKPALTKAIASRKADIKAGAQKLSNFVETCSDKELNLAAKSESAGHKLQAYDRYGAIAERFAGYSAAEKATAARRDLAKDPALKKEITSLKQLEKQRGLANSAKPAVREKARAAIQKLIDEQPDSEAARLGRELLRQK
jgi:peroxiredoxin